MIKMENFMHDKYAMNPKEHDNLCMYVIEQEIDA